MKFPRSKPPPVVVHTPEEIQRIRAAARAAANVLRRLCEAVEPGLSTKAVDQLAAEFIREENGESAFLGYHGFPGQVCISVNDQVVHGIGSPLQVLQAGDVVSLDVGVRLNGAVGDNAETVCVGGPCAHPAAKRLIETTRRALDAGIAAAVPGNHVRHIGTAVEKIVTRAGFSVVREYVGHGCGIELHEPPEVPNFGRPTPGPRLRPGMVLAIEPIVNMGDAAVRVLDDGWTVRTRDGSLSAHVEHMVLITNDKPEVLTWRKRKTSSG